MADISAQLPILALTAGDAAGVGPEIVAKAMAVAEVRQICRPVVIGWTEVMQRSADQLHLGMKVRKIERVEDARFEPDQLDILEASPLSLDQFSMGQVSEAAGTAALDAVRFAAALALNGRVNGIVTAPLNKEAVSLSEPGFTGHTEELSAVSGVHRFAMMLISGTLRIVHVSTHCSLREAIERVTTARVSETIITAAEGCVRLGIPRPRLAVAGLNPHAGENGLFGSEDQERILPAVSAARANGTDVQGPLPPDTVFLRCLEGHFDAVVAMYHDQGHIPAKLIGFKTGVNITLGLPFVRTSVDHGTAFDIAGRGIADPANMIEAIRMAARMCGAGPRASTELV